jgi:hypothetical protein
MLLNKKDKKDKVHEQQNAFAAQGRHEPACRRPRAGALRGAVSQPRSNREGTPLKAALPPDIRIKE